MSFSMLSTIEMTRINGTAATYISIEIVLLAT